MGFPLSGIDGPPLGKSRSPLLKLDTSRRPIQGSQIDALSLVPPGTACCIGWVAIVWFAQETPPDLPWILTLTNNDGEVVWNVNQNEIIDAYSSSWLSKLFKRYQFVIARRLG